MPRIARHAAVSTEHANTTKAENDRPDFSEFVDATYGLGGSACMVKMLAKF